MKFWARVRAGPGFLGRSDISLHHTMVGGFPQDETVNLMDIEGHECFFMGLGFICLHELLESLH